MRGKVSRKTHAAAHLRITPAYAGKSSMYKLNIVPDEDHPRLCGEKNLPYTKTIQLSGSPPPMRGKELI